MTTEDTDMIRSNPADEMKQKALDRYKETLLKHREQEARVREMRKNLRELNKTYDKTEEDLKALQSVGQIIGELLRQLDDERYIVKASSGPRYVVGCRNKVRSFLGSMSKSEPSVILSGQSGPVEAWNEGYVGYDHSDNHENPPSRS